MLLQVVIDSLLLSGIYALIALGLTLSLGITNILNFMHGELVMLGAYAAFWGFTLYGIDPLAGVPFLMLVGFGAGYLLFRLLIQRLALAPQINQILLTFGLGLILQNAAAIAWTADMRSANPDYASRALHLGTAFIPLGRLSAFMIACVLGTTLLVWLKWTDYGRACRAIAQNGLAATLVGIDTKAVYATAFGVSVAIAMASGATLSAITPITPFIGFGLLVKAFAIIVLGGVGTIAGTLLGAFVLGTLETVVSYYVPDGSGWAEGLAFAVMLLILILRPSGLLGRVAEA